MAYTYTSPSDVAKLVRKELKQAFPGVKFSVRTTSSGAINISYVDGPTFSDVSEIANKYEWGSFDGMQDMYVADENKSGPSVQYVFVTRDYSDEKINIASDVIRKYFEIDQETDNLSETNLYYLDSVSSWARRVLAKSDLRFTIDEIELFINSVKYN
jgi:hypothetical protein